MTNEAEALLAFHFGDVAYQKHDPNRVIVEQCSKLVVTLTYAHFRNLEEEAYKGVASFQEVQAKIGVKKKITIEMKRQKKVVQGEKVMQPIQMSQ